MEKDTHVSASDFLPDVLTLSSLRQAARGCEGCGLFRRATQTVFGEGPEKARIIMIGEQPGDTEDLEGSPFVGSAGKLLDRALKDAAIDRSQVYVTNAVKHFKWEERGKRRIHKKPNMEEINACRPWLEAEIAAIQPEVLACLGATAAQSLMGRNFRVTAERGKFFETRWGPFLTATVHPSSLLRLRDSGERRQEYSRFVQDLRGIRARLG
ncbi:MAG TPA: UdgX family uracil-DNA binding protein [Bryobacteraceae bacterium]|nr:UdgX family uracil-DNA binding protein [Bryobacteraceae bacterium]